MPYKYANKNYDKEHMARAAVLSAGISTKQAIEICSLLRKKQLAYGKELLRKALAKKKAIPFTRFNGDMGHKPGIGPGRYPQKASEELLRLLDCVEANAQFKGLDTSSLVIEHMCAHRAGKVMRYGRQRGRTAKRTHVEITVKELAKKKAEKPSKESEKGLEKVDPSQKKEQPKKEVEKETKQAEAPKKEVKEPQKPNTDVKKEEAKPAKPEEKK